MDMEFTAVFSTIDGHSFWQIADELGIRHLTIEFLCSLQVSHDGVYFHMLNQDFNLTWSQLNVTLGFDEACLLDIDHATHRFNKAKFWEAITTSHNCSKPRPNEIHNPIIRFLHFGWL